MEDMYCRWCGTKQVSDENSIMVMITVVLLFFVIGPFCLIKLWKSETISVKIKRVVTILVTVGTIFLTLYMSQKIEQILSQYINTINMINS